MLVFLSKQHYRDLAVEAAKAPAHWSLLFEALFESAPMLALNIWVSEFNQSLTPLGGLSVVASVVTLVVNARRFFKGCWAQLKANQANLHVFSLRFVTHA